MTIAGTLLLTMASAVSLGHLPDGASAPAVHSIAQVNDSRSHGQLGDGLLSLNEAIQLYNRTITVAQLSLAEVNQLSGFGADIAWAAIDASAVPTVTVERDFDLILDLPHGLLIEGYNGDAVIDFTTNNVRNGFQSNSNFNNYRNLILRGADFGVDLQQTDSSFGGCIVENVVFDSQAQFAFRMTGTSANGYTRVIFDECRFLNTPTGIIVEDQPSGRQTNFVVLNSTFDAVADGMRCLLGDLGFAALQLERLAVDASNRGIDIRRGATGNRPTTVQATFVQSTGGTGFAYQGMAGTTSNLQLRMLDLQSATNPALVLGPAGSGLGGFLQDSTIQGDCNLSVGGNPTAFSVQNLRCSGGTWTIATDSTQPVVMSECRFDNCNLQLVSTTGLVDVASSCLVGGGASAAAGGSIQVHDSYCTASLGSGTSSSNTLPTEQLGTMQMNAPLPTIGGTLDLQVDLPAGLLGLLAIGSRSDPVFEFSSSIRAYLTLGGAALIPGFYRLQQGIQIPIPNNLALLQTEWVCQAIVLPDPGMQAPAMQTPPGARFVLR